MDLAPKIYRFAARALFAPFGGLTALRRGALDALEIERGDRVLELGCGPGDLTSAMIARGARVHAVDASSEMLRAAKAQAPEASFELADLRQYTASEQYDIVLLAFVLHELAAADVPAIISHARVPLAAGGRLGILDHAVPGGRGGRIWRTVLATIEPGGIDHWIALDLLAICRTAGLATTLDRTFARGRARLVVTQRSKSAGHA